MTKKVEKNINHDRSGALQRLTDIDVAKGLTIILVVFGHIVAKQPPEDNGWYLVVKESIYRFHMAFFMFLSGVVYFKNLRTAESFRDYALQIKKRFLRLMPAYFLFAGVVFFSKWAAQSIMHVDNPVSGFYDLLGILLYPMESISAFLWYIYVLFLFCAVGLALLSLAGGRILPLIGIGVILIFVARVPLFGMDQFCKYFLFFALGGLAIGNWEKYNILIVWAWVPATALFILMFFMPGYLVYVWVPTAILSIIVLHGLCKQKIPFLNILKFLGLMSFPIYLMNTLCIGFVKAVMLKFVSWNGPNFLIFVPILTMAGLWIPVLLKLYIIPRVAWIDKITS